MMPAMLQIKAVVVMTLLATGPASRAAGQHGPIATPAAPVASEAPAEIVSAIAVPPLLKQGVAVIVFKTANVQIMPVYGAAAVAVTPRLGHLHVTLDGLPWHWVHAGTDPVVLQGLPAGPHRVLLELADANHHVVAARPVAFDIPAVARPVQH